MEKRFIGLGVLAGALAGVVSFAYARVAISPLIDGSIAFEELRSHAEENMSGAHGHEHEVFSRALQENVGTAAGSVIFGVVVGALFAVAFCIASAALRKRRIRHDPRVTAALLACGAFVATALIPSLVYPANPPGIGHDDTVAARTTAHLVVLLASVAIACVATSVAMRAASRIGGWTAAVSALAGYLVAMIVVRAVVPAFAETPQPLLDGNGAVVVGGFPADVLADFRVATLVNPALLWFVVGAVFSCVLPRVLSTATTGKEALGARR